MKRNSSVLAIFLFLASLPSVAQSKTTPWFMDLNKGNGSVEFRGIGRPSAIKIIGKGAAPSGNILVEDSRVNGVASFDLTTLDTGIDLRNRHMKEKYLQTDKFHDAKLTIDSMTLPTDAQKETFSAVQVPFTGTLSLHGIEKPVSGFANIERDANIVRLFAQFGLKVSDYQIEIPSFAGITLVDEVQVSVIDSGPVSSKVTTSKQ